MAALISGETRDSRLGELARGYVPMACRYRGAPRSDRRRAAALTGRQELCPEDEPLDVPRSGSVFNGVMRLQTRFGMTSGEHWPRRSRSRRRRLDEDRWVLTDDRPGSQSQAAKVRIVLAKLPPTPADLVERLVMAESQMQGCHYRTVTVRGDVLPEPGRDLGSGHRLGAHSEQPRGAVGQRLAGLAPLGR